MLSTKWIVISFKLPMDSLPLLQWASVFKVGIKKFLAGQGVSKMSVDEAGADKVMRFGWPGGSLLIQGGGRVTQPLLATQWGGPGRGARGSVCRTQEGAWHAGSLLYTNSPGLSLTGG